MGLTAKEVRVLQLLVEGASNPEIAERMSRSRRTIVHHVSAILGKLCVANRLEAILRAIAEPWIVRG
jgi:DNA-binding NarL/FixJ family response regulator